MDYPLENLGPERFQELCQALLTKEFPNIQCFPVAQPDGGRDAISYTVEEPGRGFIMYQVKYVRNPSAEEDPHQWLTKIMQLEASKLKQQIPNGAKQYILITNIKGTAHPDVGSIDKLNKALSTELTVPAMCWWRDDVDRRLDNAWDLKWTYPEIMTGPDLIRSILESGLTENREQRISAIRAFLRDQLDKDQEVRFKQVDLQNNLFDLYIDVPIAPPQTSSGRRGKHIYLHYHRLVARDIQRKTGKSTEIELPEDIIANEFSTDYILGREERSKIGAAALLMHPIIQRGVPRMVLEGAPGQGKSTITQYICQIHRIKILNKRGMLQNLPENHQNAPTRLPFRVDLRDLATWIAKRNPFSHDGNDAPLSYWQKSLESFLAAQVRHYSGGTEFTVDDLISIMKLSAVLLVFDGLDEVADISRRKEVVEEIVKGVNRLEENTASLQVIVTSRPAAFANSPGLPEDKFPYYHLDSVTRSLIDEYAEKWLKARRLQGREAAEVRKVLREKLTQPHLRDLAKNTMQLTILLSLVHTRGISLPDKRTALYDSYVELFFNREAEKSSIVRDHRDLLINIHRYLAWILHTESELGNNTGSITEDRLHDLLGDYLSAEGYEPSLATTLFTGMVERVVALVSRVEGTYEFEVQPLREYFAARYLYETAPYSPTGNEQRGTKPDRFDAMARNFYWLNVTRFYAGCYSKGELPSLIDRLQELINEDGYKLISHPRVLAAMLLSDWVFTQHPKSVNQVIDLILDGIGLRYVLMADSRRVGVGNPLVLPKQSGRDELINRCFKILLDNPPRDYAFDIIDLIRSNPGTDELKSIWFKYLPSETNLDLRISWLEYGLHLGVLSKLSIEELNKITNYTTNDNRIVSLLFRAKRFDYLEKDESSISSVLGCILRGEITTFRRQKSTSILELLCHCIDSSQYTIAFRSPQSVPLTVVWENHPRGMVDIDKEVAHIELKASSTELSKCFEAIKVSQRVAEYHTRDWSTSINPWNELIEGLRTIFGDQWSIYHLASASSGIRSQTETCKDFNELLDHTVPLAKRARYARLRSGSIPWWTKQFQAAKDNLDKMLILLILLTWANQATVLELLDKIEASLSSLTNSEWFLLYEAITSGVIFARNHAHTHTRQFTPGDFPDLVSDRFAVLMSARTRDEEDEVIFLKYLSDYDGNDPKVLQFCQEQATSLVLSHKSSWNEIMNIISRSYMKGVVSEPYSIHRFTRNEERISLSIEVAEQIASNPDRYPSFLVVLAESICKSAVASWIIPVGQVAKDEKWFEI